MNLTRHISVSNRAQAATLSALAIGCPRKTRLFFFEEVVCNARIHTYLRNLRLGPVCVCLLLSGVQDI